MPEQSVARSSVSVFADAGALAEAAAERVVAAAVRAIESQGRFVVALSGGSTPRRTYEQIAAMASRVNWALVHVVWVDERCVPPDNAESNYRLARETLLDRVSIPAANVRRMHGEDDPAAAAASYERMLRTLLATPSGAPTTVPGKRIDLAVMGLGDNGHTASIFPRSAALDERERWVMAERVSATPPWRITLTAPLLDACAELLFLVTGSGKASVLQRVLEGPRQRHELPAQLIAPTSGELRWLVDEAAASQLRARA
jgi:6-phosphogluconolactonase